MNSTPTVPGDRPLIFIGCKYISQKVPGFSYMEVAVSALPGVTYLSHYPDDYSNVGVVVVDTGHQSVRFVQIMRCLSSNLGHLPFRT